VRRLEHALIWAMVFLWLTVMCWLFAVAAS